MFNLNVKENSDKISLFWEFDDSRNYVSFHLYYSFDNSTYSLLKNIVLCARPIGGATAVEGSLSWKELL